MLLRTRLVGWSVLRVLPGEWQQATNMVCSARVWWIGVVVQDTRVATGRPLLQLVATCTEQSCAGTPQQHMPPQPKQNKRSPANRSWPPSQNDFDVCWCKGSIAELIFTPLVQRIQAQGGKVGDSA